MGHFFSDGGFVMWCDSADMMPYSIHCIQYTMRHDCISFSLSSLLCRRFYLPNTFQLFLVCILCFFFSSVRLLPNAPCLLLDFPPEILRSPFFFSFCSFSFAQCQFISWLLQHLTANFHFHGSHGSAQERARQQWTRTRQSNGDAFVGAAAAIYIYTFNAQNRIYDDKPFVVGLTKDNGIQVKCANIIKIIQRTVRHHLTIT